MSELLNIKDDAENLDTVRGCLRMFEAGKSEIRHLGKDWRVRSGALQFDTYLPATIRVQAPDAKGACNIVIDVTNLATQPQGDARPLHPRIRGQVKFSTKSREPVCYFFLDESAFSARLDMARRLVKAGKVAGTDLQGIMSERELRAL